METMTNTTGGPDSPREIVERMFDILRGALDADRLDDLGARLALVATIAEEKVTAWRKLAELCGQYLDKGRDVLVEGKCSASGWTGQDGTPKATLELTANKVTFLGGKRGRRSKRRRLRKTRTKSRSESTHGRARWPTARPAGGER